MKAMRAVRCTMVAVTALFTTTAARADVLSEPILRIETEQHTAVIRRLDVDRAGKVLVTGSRDKTARVWSLPQGKLLKVLRPPIGPGDEGKVYAVAISPDGKTVAVRGWTGPTWGEVYVYLFDQESGQITRRLGGLENVVLNLAFSSDGQRLAAGLGGKSGIRVWRTSDWQQELADREYKDNVYGVAFASDGRLAATSFDGFVRLYDAQLRRIAKEKAPGGELPYCVAFAPDGTRLAVGYDDTTAVSVLSARDLKLLFAPDTSGLVGRDLSSVAWSADGRSLWAGGTLKEAGKIILVRWADRGRGARSTLPTTTSTIMDLKAFGAGIAVANGNPAFSIVAADGKRVLFRGPEQADLYRDNVFAVAKDGRSVRFAMDLSGKQPVRFDLAQRRVEMDAPEDRALTVARTQAAGLEITDWYGQADPKLAGKRLALDQYERSHSAAIGSDGKRFALGAEWSLRLFDAQGAEVWRKPVPDFAWAVNVTGDGRLVIARYGDGTIRWHRISDGEEVLALFVHRDGQRWVAWTPQGYYDASANGDILIGWHVNRGRDQAADFFPAAQFRERFYRPDVIARVLDTLDVGEALRQADAATGRQTKGVSVASVLPPVVAIKSPKDGVEAREPSLQLTYRVRSPTGKPILEISASADGRPIVEAKREVLTTAGGEETGLMTIALPKRDVQVSLLARTEDGVSEPATIAVRWRGPGAAAKGNLYVLAVGVRNYRAFRDLKYADRDASEFAGRLKRQEGVIFGKVQVNALLNEQATKMEIEDGIDWIRRQVTEGDIGVVFLSGHGKNDLQGDYFFLPYDVDDLKLFATAVSKDSLRKTFDRTVGKVVVFLDTCHAGGVQMASTKGVPPDINGLVNELARAGRGVVVFASSTGTQLSIELDDPYRHGAFSQALIEALDGGTARESADYNRDGAISTDELAVYIRNRVKALTRNDQTPVTAKPDATPDFPLAALR